MKNKEYQIFNHSSEFMPEIKNETIDLIITSIPFNTKATYFDYSDSLSFDEYVLLIKKVFFECHRVSTKEGLMIVEVADSVLMEGRYILLSALVASTCKDIGWYLKKRDINFLCHKNFFEVAGKDFDKDFQVKETNGHSNCTHWLVFEKTYTKFNEKSGKIFYYNYNEKTEEGVHPCPFPKTVQKQFLKDYYKKGFNILDPFMGTAELGKEIIKRNGTFYGYEISKESFIIAAEKLKSRIK